jgi:hypothetical protein
MSPDALLVCAQAGEVNTGAFDPLEKIADATRSARGWLHVDGHSDAAGSSSSSSAAARRHGGSRTVSRRCPVRSCSTRSGLNQVLFRFETDERTDGVLARVQEDGRVWMSGTTWDGQKAIRISVSNWQTDDAEIDLALQAFRDAVGAPAHAPAR